MFCSGTSADFRKRGKPRKARVQKNEFPAAVLSRASFGSLSSLVDRAVFFVLCSSQSIAEGRAGEKLHIVMVDSVAGGLL